MTENNQSWNHVREVIKAKWSALTDRQVDAVHGNLGLLVEKVEMAYGCTREEAQRQYYEFQGQLAEALNAGEAAQPKAPEYPTYVDDDGSDITKSA